MKTSPYKTRASAYPDAYGYRSGLFTTAFSVDTTVLNNITLQLERDIAKRLYKRGQQARDEARLRVPVKSGALRASIYVTAPGNKAVLENARAGKGIPAQHNMLGHSQGYYRAIHAAGKRMQNSPIGAGDFFSGMVHHRTQQWNDPNKKRGLRDLMEEVGYEDSPEEALRIMSEEAPFTGMGAVSRNAFFVGFGVAAYYAAWVEFGTSKQKAQPYFSEPAERFVADTERIIAESFRSLDHG